MGAEAAKRAAGEAAAELVDPGSRVGIGTGSTALWFIHALGRRVREGMDVRGVPTSMASAALAHRLGIPIVELDRHGLDIAVDGADQVDPELRLIKGAGGAMVREKIVAAAARRVVIIVDDSKLVPHLDGSVPVELFPFGIEATLALLEERAGCGFALRFDEEGNAARSDNGNLIADSEPGVRDDPAGFAALIESVPGLAGHGLFLGLTDLVMVGHDDGAVEPMRRLT